MSSRLTRGLNKLRYLYVYLSTSRTKNPTLKNVHRLNRSIKGGLIGLTNTDLGDLLDPTVRGIYI